MKLIIDIECNSLVRPTKIWCIVCKDPDTGVYYEFKQVHEDEAEKRRFLALYKSVSCFIGHNWLEYDYPVIVSILGSDFKLDKPFDVSLDTLVLSRLFDYSRNADPTVAQDSEHVVRRTHSIESYGEEFKLPKGDFNDWTHLSPEMVEYCRRDVDICERIYRKFLRRIRDDTAKPSIQLEQQFQCITNDMHDHGFCFNSKKATALLDKVTKELGDLDGQIDREYPARLRLVREIHPKLTRFGTLNKSDFRWVKGGDLSEFTGDPFCRCEWVQFNKNSHKQLIDVLTMAGWHPTDKTTTHLKCKEPDEHMKKYGWKVNENNLSTLPSTSPSSAKLLAKRILLESRRRTLTEWLSLVAEDGRIHGKFYGIGAWTHRMAHQEPNTANIPNDTDTQGKTKLLGKELRSLWCAGKGRLLVGCDAEGIQLRIFAHLINDKEFTDALVTGKKSDKTDPHSLNQRVLGSVCKSRQAAKRFIYALLLGAGIGKLSEVLDTTVPKTQEALDRLLQKYTGWERLRSEDIPRDARRGYFIGLDGRRVQIPGDTVGERKHLAMSGYLQCGEAVVMKLATTLFYDKLKEFDAFLVDMVHDEWQVECPNNVSTAIKLGEIMSDALSVSGIRLGLRCPLAGSYYNDDIRDYTIGTNWSVTH